MIVDCTAYYRSDRTFYTEYGDVFAYANALICAAIPVAASYDRRRSRKKETKNARRTH
jgi:hypothetical protein